VITPGQDYRIYPQIKYKGQVDSSEFSFTGYLFHQRKKISPANIQGVLIRIKGVGIGGYDRTFLHYPKTEGPMLNQLSGEIYVHAGLEDALNIDRNSFNESHPHFLKLQDFLWKYLGEGKDAVFKDIRRRSKERQEKLHLNVAAKELSDFVAKVETMSGRSFSLSRSSVHENTPYEYLSSKKTIVFYNNPFWAKNKATRAFQEKMILSLVVARLCSTNMDVLEETVLKFFSNEK